MTWIGQAYADIKNYRKVLKAIRKNKNTPEWEYLGLSSDWIGRIYKVINLPKEYEGDDKLIRNSLSADMAVQYGDYLTKKMAIADEVFQAVEVKSKRSYLYVWSPIFRYITIFKAINFMWISWLAVTLLIYAANHADAIINLFSFLNV